VAKYEVKKVDTGIEKGKWGVYKDGKLLKAFSRKGSATRDKDHRQREG
jgi:hypothetical protein